MSGWTALCIAMLAIALNKPAIGFLAFFVYALVDSPRQRCEKLARKIKELERRAGL